MSPFHRKSLAGLFWIRMCVAHLRIPLVVIAALILAGVLAVHAEAADRAGKTFRDCEMCPEMVIIPPGKFIMGSPETEKDRDADEGQHTVVITYSFAVSKGPITWDLWDACVRDGVCDGPSVEAALRLDRNGKPIQDYVDHVRGNHFAGPLNGRRRHSVFGIKIPVQLGRHCKYCSGSLSNAERSQRLLGKIKNANLPVMIVQGDKDTVVPPENTRTWADSMKEMGMKYEYVEVPGGDHGTAISGGMPNIFKFFADHLKAGVQ